MQGVISGSGGIHRCFMLGLEDLDIRRVPAEPFIEKDPFAFRDFSKTDKEIKEEEEAEMAALTKTYGEEWEAWGSELIERLELSN